MMNKQDHSTLATDSHDARHHAAGSIRVLVVDDHPAIREALAGTIRKQEDLQFVGEAASAEDALPLVRQLQSDVVIVDIALADVHGLDLVRNITSQYADVHVVVFSMYDELAYAERAIRAGAAGYLMKSEPTQTVMEAIRCVHRGEVYLSRRMASRILSKVVKRHEYRQGFAIDALTDREMAVFQMLGQGYSVDDITRRLHLSRKTVETYRRRVKEKLGLDTVADLLQYAVQWTYGHVGAE